MGFLLELGKVYSKLLLSLVNIAKQLLLSTPSGIENGHTAVDVIIFSVMLVALSEQSLVNAKRSTS